MPTARFELAAATVNNKIYAIGGDNATTVVATVEEYDPATNTWSTKSPMPTARRGLAAATANNKIYAIGGTLNSATSVATVEEYDPPTDTWRARSPMPTARGGLAAAVVRLPFSGERIHVVGGESFGEGSRTFDNNEAYDPVDDTWSTKAPMPLGRHGLAAQAIDDEVYVIAGGQTPGLSVSDYVYRLVQHDLPPVTIDEQAPPIEAGE